ncbi:MAG: tetratricopeptide repeat protein [Anaerolineae bacterium]|nr:tetratricopeptide repeat protein [Anaerolineae bacterium]
MHQRERILGVRRWLPLALFCVVCLALGLFPESHDLIDAVVQGNAWGRDRHYSAALDAYAYASTLCPGCALPHMRRGQVLTVQGRYNEAWTAYLEAVRLGGDSDLLQEGLARLYLAQGVPDLAAAALRRVLDRRPARAGLWLSLAEAYRLQGTRTAELEAWLAALELDLGDEQQQRAHSRVALLCIEVEAACALAHLSQVRLGPDRVWLDAAEAMLDALERIETGQDSAPVRTRLGQTLLDLGEVSLARQQFARAVKLDPAYAEGYAYLGYAASLLDEIDLAEQYFEQALQLQPDSVLPRLFLGLHYARRGWWHSARDVLIEAYDLAPTNAAICAAVAETYLNADPPDYAAAGQWLHVAVDNAPEEASFHLLLAHFYVDYGVEPFPRGVTVARVVVELAPGSAEAQETLGWAYFLSDWFDPALVSLGRAYDLAQSRPQQARIAYRLGQVYEALGDVRSARQFYQQALDLDWIGLVGDRARQRLEKD